MSMLKKEIEFMDDKLFANLDPEGNKYITETAGFVPLEVKFKRFEQAGQIMQFSASEFTSSDLRDIYLNPDFEITPEDDYEDIQEKINARNEYILQLQKNKLKVGSFGKTADLPSDSAAAETKVEVQEQKDSEKKEPEKKQEK